MNPLRFRIALAAMFWCTGYVFDWFIAMRPAGEYWDMTYFAGAATVDWFMYYLSSRFVSGKLQSDVEALCIASIVTNALGFALYMADSPPDFYNWVIKVINYALAIRLTFLGGGDVLNYSYWRDLVRSAASRYIYSAKEKAK